MAFHERTLDEYAMGKASFKLSIIVTDSNFKKIDELMLPEGRYEYETVFVSKEGLHIARQIDFQPYEDQLIFDVFGFKE